MKTLNLNKRFWQVTVHNDIEVIAITARINHYLEACEVYGKESTKPTQGEIFLSEYTCLEDGTAEFIRDFKPMVFKKSA